MDIKRAMGSPILRLAGYFLLLVVVTGLVAMAVPWFPDLLVPSQPGESPFPGAMGPSTAELVSTVSQTAILGLMALLAALAFSAPVVWIYTVIMRQEGYDRAFVRLMASLPVVVAGVVQVVRGDLALAFALAGIVAAVRFRTTVKDLQDAVFAFAAIAIGLATGTGNFTLAGAISTIFCGLSYALWRGNVGDVGPSLTLTHGGVQLSEALAPGESHKAVIIGDDDAADPIQTEDLPALADHIDRLADYVRADALRKKSKYNTLLLVYTDQPDEATDHVEEVLDDHARRWVLVDEIQRNGSGLVALEYLLRLKKKVDVGTMVDRFGCGNGAPCVAAELKPIKGLRKRLT
jgi:hypothetical protein